MAGQHASDSPADGADRICHIILNSGSENGAYWDKKRVLDPEKSA
jgi:hypothetical protein